MGKFAARTDLALEARESINEEEQSLRGVEVEEYSYSEENIHVTKVKIDTRNASKIMGKPMGVYVTMEAPDMTEEDEGFHREISHCIAKEIRDIMPNAEGERSVLVVGLGNREVTADSLGPKVVDNLFITRHVIRTYGKMAYNREKMNQISSIEPGVMAKTGMETAEIVKGIIEETRPDIIIAVDALASRSTKRLNRTVQITDTGIWPGSGVGNHRNALTKESLGVPVIAIGIPTVVDAATIVGDAFEKLLEEERRKENNFECLKYWEQHGNLYSQLNNMYMTGKDIDAVIKRISFTVSEGINMALEQVGNSV